jgi:hypothetical protein
METSSGQEKGAPPTLKEDSSRMEIGKKRHLVKGKKKGSNREVLTLWGVKRQDTALRRKLKRKSNQQRGKAGLPSIRKEKNTMCDQEDKKLQNSK